MFELFKKENEKQKEPIKIFQRLARLYEIYDLKQIKHDKIKICYPACVDLHCYDVSTKLGIRTISMFYFYCSDKYEFNYYHNNDLLFQVTASQTECRLFPMLKINQTCDWIHLAIEEIAEIFEDAYANYKCLEMHHKIEEERLGNM